MGLSARVCLIVGVRLKDLGDIRVEHKKYDRIRFGKVEGQDVKDYHILTTPNANDYCVATGENNKWHGGDFSTMFSTDAEAEEWVHLCQYSHVYGYLIGLEVGPDIDGDEGEYVDLQSFKGSRLINVIGTIDKVKMYLKRRFGYEGDVYVIAYPSYSY